MRYLSPVGRGVKINLCRDPALVAGWCWRLRTQRSEWYLWHYRWRVNIKRVVIRQDG
jgi:hypothetical protein